MHAPVQPLDQHFEARHKVLRFRERLRDMAQARTGQDALQGRRHDGGTMAARANTSWPAAMGIARHVTPSRLQTCSAMARPTSATRVGWRSVSCSTTTGQPLDTSGFHVAARRAYRRKQPRRFVQDPNRGVPVGNGAANDPSPNDEVLHRAIRHMLNSS